MIQILAAAIARGTSFRAIAEPASVSGSSLTPGTVISESSTCTGIPGGGTFSWARVSGDTSIIATSSALATTTFQAEMDTQETIQAVFQCTYTLNGQNAVSNNVTVSLTLN